MKFSFWFSYYSLIDMYPSVITKIKNMNKKEVNSNVRGHAKGS